MTCLVKRFTRPEKGSSGAGEGDVGKGVRAPIPERLLYSSAARSTINPTSIRGLL